MSLELDRVHALCFDVDGTLSDTDDMFVRRLAHWLLPFRFLFAARDSHPFARHLVMLTETPANRLLGLFDRLGIDDKISRLGDAIYRLGLGRSPQPFLLIPGIMEMLAQLRPHFPISIVSARGSRNTQRFIDQFGLAGFFTSIATAHTCQHSKPFPDPVLWAASQMGVLPEHCLMIGDTVVDIQAGKAAGAQTVGVLCGFGREDELRAAGADLILLHTPQIAGVLLT